MKSSELAPRFFAILVSLTLIAAPALAQSQQQPPTQTAQADDKQKSKKDMKDKEDVDKIGNRDVDGKVNFYSLETEVALGKQFAQEIERSARIIDDPIVSEYVNRVGQNLVRNSDAKVPFTIKVVDSDELNAFALPGGFFYVNSGLILAATEEAELAGVMAHEIAHVTARHGTRQATKGQIVQLAMLPLLIFGPGGWAGYGLYQGLNFLIPVTFLKFTRDAEREADFLGLQYMYKTGYDPNAYIAFFEKVQSQEKKRPGSIPKVFSSHPPSAERIRNTQNEISTILPTRAEYVVSTSEFDFVKERLRQMQSVTQAQESDPDKPTLRKRTEKEADKKSKDKTKTEEDDDRPTLKRRP
jgi:predicted Zn-dependent protease